MSTPLNFFLPGPAGDLFAMYYPPAGPDADGISVLYVHPFAGEMLASRNMIATLARRLSCAGVGVLTVDLFGCGDSSGDFSKARWDIWREDLSASVRWLREQGRERICLWGLRLGALLAIDFAAHSHDTYDKILLWQPVVRADLMLDQFFRMNLVPENGNQKMATRIANQDLRRSLVAGEIVEADGYPVPSELISAMDRLSIAPLGGVITAPIHWLEVVKRSEQPFHADNLHVVEEWTGKGVQVTLSKVLAAPFWLFPYSTESGELADSVITAFRSTSNG